MQSVRKQKNGELGTLFLGSQRSLTHFNTSVAAGGCIFCGGIGEGGPQDGSGTAMRLVARVLEFRLRSITGWHCLNMCKRICDRYERLLN